MTVRAPSKIVHALTSAPLATLLLVFVGVWSMLASFVPQGAATDAKVVTWASAHPFAELVVRAVGLHRAFGAPVFVLCIAVLAVSTAFCARKRTKVALSKGRLLRSAQTVDLDALTANHDLEIPCDPALSESRTLSMAAEALGRIGIRSRAQGKAIVAISSRWSLLGSPVFHWALLALMVTMLLGNLMRSSGQMGLAVGQEKVDEPASYGILTAGPLHRRVGGERSVRVDAFELTFKTGGVHRGPTPTVTVLDAQGGIIKSQRVYPNHTLKTGSLTIYPADYGLTASVSLADANGVEMGREVQLVDFSSEADDGTAPVGYFTVDDAAGSSQKVHISVPLDRVKGGLVARLPDEPKARVVLSTDGDAPVLDRVLGLGESLQLPGGESLRLLDLGYYARLQLVDDPTIPILYVVLVFAVVGLGIATLTRQQIVQAAVIETPNGSALAVRVRLWRNATSALGEIESELLKALAGPAKEGSA